MTTLRQEPYWLVLQTRLFSNVLTELVLVPAIVFVARDGWTRVARGAPGPTRFEALLLAAALGGVALFFAVGPQPGRAPAMGSLETPVAFFIPFILWGTVASVPRARRWSWSCRSLMIIWGATHGQAGFASPPTRRASSCCRSPSP